MKFAHLHVHTMYSLLDGSSKIPEIVAEAKRLGMEHLAITDHGVMYGAIDFYKECKKQGIHPIIGCEVYVAEYHLKKEGRADKEYNHLILLAENEQGYHNLIKLVSLGHLEGFYYKPRIDYELLQQYHEGLIALSACLAGLLPQTILNEGYEKACQYAREYANLFGPDHFYLELQNHGIADEAKVARELVRMSKELNLPLVCTNDVHYTYQTDKEAHDVLLCIQTAKKIQDEERMRYEGDYYLKSPEEMAQLFGAIPEALENTVKIAEMCQLEFKFHELKLPAYDVPKPYTANEYLRMLCENGLKERYPQTQDPTSQEGKAIRDRFDYELGVIEKMGYVDYFLIVWDYINFAREHGIMVGPGRGSAAGSIISYCIHITNIDPLKYNLLFERFLNPERVSMPDIDVDFCFARRQEVIDYVIRKYGPTRVSQIVTFGTMKARLVVRDVGRALDLSYADTDRIAKMIPRDLDITIDKALEVNSELRGLYESDANIKRLIDMSRRLEGLPRHSSTHACGVVISAQDTMNYVPMILSQEGTAATQYTMTTLEELGLLKMDFLGLRNLTVIRDCNALLGDKAVDVDRIPMDDEKVYQMLSAGDTTGVFQLESAGMRSFMKELKPTCLEDIIAGISLYRPGPMDFIPKYIEGKKNPTGITYKTPLLEPILKTTYGCIVYQEQVMQIVRDLAGYTLGRSDLVRRAMSKKKADVMAKERLNFVEGNPEEGVPGCAANGISREIAEEIFDEMTDFAKYAFNKSHAAAYAVIAYQTAYLKAHYPVEFMAAMMTSVIDHPDKCLEYIRELKGMKVELLPPDINKSLDIFGVETVADANGIGQRKAIRYALSAIKNVGHTAIMNLEQERKQNGPFTDMDDFCERMQDKDINKRSLENLICAGAFDSLGGKRSQYRLMFESCLKDAVSRTKEQMSGQIDLFSLGDDAEDNKKRAATPLPNINEYPLEMRLSLEKEALGIYLSGHPLEADAEAMKKYVTNSSLDFAGEAEDEGLEGTDETEDLSVGNHLSDGQRVTVGGIVRDIKAKTTKSNTMMAFVTLEDMDGSLEILFFPKIYDEYRMLLQKDLKIYVAGRVSASVNEDSKLIAEQIATFDHPENLAVRPQFRTGRDGSATEPPKHRTLYISVESYDAWKLFKEGIVKCLADDHGVYPVIIECRQEGKKIYVPAEYNTWAKPATRALLGKIVGEQNVALKE